MPSRRAFLVVATATTAGCTGSVLTPPRIAGQPCPPVDVPEDRAVCSHTDTAGGIDVSASPASVSTARESLESVRLRIENGTDAPARYDPGRWRLYRNRGLGWDRRGETYGVQQGVETMPPGNSASWSGIDALFELGATGRTPAGLYAAVLPVETGGELVACVFLFRVARD